MCCVRDILFVLAGNLRDRVLLGEYHNPGVLTPCTYILAGNQNRKITTGRLLMAKAEFCLRLTRGPWQVISIVVGKSHIRSSGLSHLN